MELFTVGPEYYARAQAQRQLGALAAFGRINALSAIKSAEHGWLGASLSVAEILTALYFELGLSRVVLSKGHAAAMQYACLHGLGRMSRAELLRYKDGVGAPQAHTDRGTPGIWINTGSLGQALSKVAGLASVSPNETHAVILGDGELQEGQNYEAFMTLCHRGLTNVVTLVDINGFQSKQRVAAVKRLPELAELFQSFGFDVRAVEGHDIVAVADACRGPIRQPRVVLAYTTKAAGSPRLAPEGEAQPWHGRVPDDSLYLSLLEEWVQAAAVPELGDEFARYRTGITPISGTRPRHVGSTRDAYVARLTELLEQQTELRVLDADLAEACGIEGLRGHPRYLEMGICEQDLVSFAGGLALAGLVPVVNTYAAFFKRAFEQVYVNATEAAHLVYVGHYAGLCYYTDGKTHQSISDISMMRAVPGMVVLEPVTASQTRQYLDWALTQARGSVYLRLRRLPVTLPFGDTTPEVARPLYVKGRGEYLFVSMGTQAAALVTALRAQGYGSWGHAAVGMLGGPVDHAFWAETLRAVRGVVTLEEDLAPGALSAWFRDLVASLGSTCRVESRALEGFGASFRTLSACLEHFGYTVPKMSAWLEERLRCGKLG